MLQRLLGNPVHLNITWSNKDLTFASIDPDPEDGQGRARAMCDG